MEKWSRYEAMSGPPLPSSSRYEILTKIASGGMATVYVGRVRGAVGFWRLVAIKRAHPQLLQDESFKRMLMDEALLVSRIHHPHVAAVLDVEEIEGELLLVLDYVEGTSLAHLLSEKTKEIKPLPARLAVRIALDACAGLQAAHELTDERGKLLRIVHRDVSPQNLLVGVDGLTRLTDFGIAKHAHSLQTTVTGALKGKLAYIAPEYVDSNVVEPRGDIFSLGIVLWEAIAQRRLFKAPNDVELLKQVVEWEPPLLSSVAPWVGRRLDEVVATALQKSPSARFESAKAFGAALEAAAGRSDLIASHAEVAEHVRFVAGEALEQRRARIRASVGAEGDIEQQISQHAPSGGGRREEGGGKREGGDLPRGMLNQPSELVPASSEPEADTRAVIVRGEASSLGATARVSLDADVPVIPMHQTRWSLVLLLVLAAGVVIAALVFLASKPGVPVTQSVQAATSINAVSTSSLPEEAGSRSAPTIDVTSSVTAAAAVTAVSSSAVLPQAAPSGGVSKPRGAPTGSVAPKGSGAATVEPSVDEVPPVRDPWGDD